MSINRTLTEEMIARNITTREDITLYINKTNIYPDSPIGAIQKIAGSYEARDAIIFYKKYRSWLFKLYSYRRGHPLLRCDSKL